MADYRRDRARLTNDDAALHDPVWEERCRPLASYLTAYNEFSWAGLKDWAKRQGIKLNRLRHMVAWLEDYGYVQTWPTSVDRDGESRKGWRWALSPRGRHWLERQRHPK